MIPVLNQHDHTNVIGRLYMEGDKMFVEFVQPINEKRMLNCGYYAIEYDHNQNGTRMIKKAEILEFSLNA